MLFLIPQQALAYGFVIEGLGAHSSRTLMLKELRLLFLACPPTASLREYAAAIVEGNVLLKQTASTCKESLRRLRELYALSSDVLLFRALRELWEQQPEAQPLLALLCAAARDPVLRATALLIFDTPAGITVTPPMIAEAARVQFAHLNPMTLEGIGRHAASTWAQAGHLRGRVQKTRARAECHSTSVTYALLLGYLCGERGAALFQTPWARLLDAPLLALQEQARAAAQQGWLEYRHVGDVTEIGFRYLLREARDGGD